MDTNARAASATQDALARVREELKGTLCEHMGMDVLSLTASTAHLSMPVAPNRQPQGSLHGGASIALAETAISLAARTHAECLYGEGAAAVGTSFSATHHAPAREGFVHVTAHAQHLGRTHASYLAEIRREDGTLVSTVLGTARLFPTREEIPAR